MELQGFAPYHEEYERLLSIIENEQDDDWLGTRARPV